MAVDITQKNGILSFAVRVVPRASRTEIIGEHDGALKIRVSSPPVDGAANDEIIKLLAKTFGVARGNISITAGLSSRTKRISIAAADNEKIFSILQAKNQRDIFQTQKR